MADTPETSDHTSIRERITGRIIHPSKRSRIPEAQPPILQLLGLLGIDDWLAEATEFETRFS